MIQAWDACNRNCYPHPRNLVIRPVPKLRRRPMARAGLRSSCVNLTLACVKFTHCTAR